MKLYAQRENIEKVEKQLDEQRKMLVDEKEIQRKDMEKLEKL